MKIGLITLGCDKNTVDMEYLAGLLEAAECEVVSLETVELSEEFDAVVVMTCGFICDAKRQSLEALAGLAGGKTAAGNPKRIFVAGCLAQRYARELLAGMPEIDGLAGVGQWDAVVQMIMDNRGGQQAQRCLAARAPVVKIQRDMPRKRLDEKPYAFLKIADGCNHHCSFCSIPLMKGRFCSVPPAILLREAGDLLAQGVRELNLVAQDISVYGLDRKGECGLPELLRRLCGLPGDFWVRCLYCYPGGVTDELLAVIAEEPKIVPYLDIPLQHLDVEILRRMKRPFADLDAAVLAGRIRRAVPGIVLRTTMLTGFPGESPQAHRRMLAGMEQIRFERLGAFSFSSEEGTEAASLPRPVGKRTREKRYNAVMELQAELSAEWNESRVGQRVRVLVEGYDSARGQWIGRSAAEAPEVDGVVYLSSGRTLLPGDFVMAEIVESEVYDVVARVTSSLR